MFITYLHNSHSQQIEINFCYITVWIKEHMVFFSTCIYSFSSFFILFFSDIYGFEHPKLKQWIDSWIYFHFHNFFHCCVFIFIFYFVSTMLVSLLWLCIKFESRYCETSSILILPRIVLAATMEVSLRKQKLKLQCTWQLFYSVPRQEHRNTKLHISAHYGIIH